MEEVQLVMGMTERLFAAIVPALTVYSVNHGSTRASAR